jgi:hypothetical protein
MGQSSGGAPAAAIAAVLLTICRHQCSFRTSDHIMSLVVTVKWRVIQLQRPPTSVPYRNTISLADIFRKLLTAQPACSVVY